MQFRLTAQMRAPVAPARERALVTVRRVRALATAALGALMLLPAAHAAAPEARVIVKLRADSPLLRSHALAATDDAVRAGRAQALGARLGLALRAGSTVAERTQVLHGAGIGSAQLAERLRASADVEWAVVDQRRLRRDIPNDPLFAGAQPAPVTPTVGQWTLRAPAPGARSSINATAAWDVTLGRTSIVVAVLDSGVRFDHPDLLPVALGGNLLAGYDMIADAATAGDGNGRDADASDAGDFLTQAEIDADPANFEGCQAQGYSSWHGLQVAAVIGASSDNNVGMAGVVRRVRILPVRVLGKCGGFDSDIIPAIRWAAGVHVPGLPANPNPARVINLSLGAPDDCSAAYREAVADANAAGAVVVASAGNGSGHAVESPANCAGVIAVAGLRNIGSKVGYSSLGPEVALSAPAGNCINEGAADPCLYPILTLTNLGLTTPIPHAGGGSGYTDSFDYTVGTSFSAPLVAGAAALVLAANPALAPLEVKQIMQTTARAFPQRGSNDPTVQRCTAPQLDASFRPIDQLECYCNNGVCGAGMLDAGAAALAAFTGTPLPLSRARIDLVDAVAPHAGEPVQLLGTLSEAASGRFITGYRWTIVDSGGIAGSIDDPTADRIVVRPAGPGRFTVRLTLTDSAPLDSSTDLTVAVLAGAPPPPPDDSGCPCGGSFDARWLYALALVLPFSSPRRSGARRGRARRT